MRLPFLLPFVLWCAACSGTQDRGPSIWPPADWYLEVRVGELCVSGITPFRSFQAWSDGYVLYREAEGANGDTPAPWPAVWSRVSAYQMRPESTRQLARLVATTGIEAVPAESGSVEATEGVVLSCYLRAFGKSQRFTARGAADPKVARLLHVVNAYLPKGETLRLPDMTGDPEDAHLARVPAPLLSRHGALDVHESLFLREPGGEGFLLDAFALAVGVGDRARAERLLHRIEIAESRIEGPLEIEGDTKILSRTLRPLLPK